jgi:transposase
MHVNMKYMGTTPHMHDFLSVVKPKDHSEMVKARRQYHGQTLSSVKAQMKDAIKMGIYRNKSDALRHYRMARMICTPEVIHIGG